MKTAFRTLAIHGKTNQTVEAIRADAKTTFHDELVVFRPTPAIQKIQAQANLAERDWYPHAEQVFRG